MTIQIHLWDMIRGNFGPVRRLGITLTYGSFADSDLLLSWGWHCGFDYLTSKEAHHLYRPAVLGWKWRCEVL